ncbi:MAG: SH3 domain-containing protein [Planctomycetota bacterium]
MRHLTLLLTLLFLLPGLAFGAPDAFDDGVAAFRRGDYAEASELWTELLGDPLSDADRARVLYNLGNAAWRSDAGGEALGWYGAALRCAPRHEEARANAAFVREELGLAPLETGDLRGAFRRLAESRTRSEAAWTVLAAALILLIALLGEALRGGPLWRGFALAAAAALLIVLVPWIQAERTSDRDLWMAVADPRSSLRSEPRGNLPAIDALDAGDVAERIDELPGWVRLETRGGLRGWVPEDEVFRLRR